MRKWLKWVLIVLGSLMALVGIVFLTLKIAPMISSYSAQQVSPTPTPRYSAEAATSLVLDHFRSVHPAFRYYSSDTPEFRYYSRIALVRPGIWRVTISMIGTGDACWELYEQTGQILPVNSLARKIEQSLAQQRELKEMIRNRQQNNVVVVTPTPKPWWQRSILDNE